MIKCRDCDYWEPLNQEGGSADGNVRVGVCRAGPPGITAVVLPVLGSPLAPPQQPKLRIVELTIWPKPSEIESCEQGVSDRVRAKQADDERAERLKKEEEKRAKEGKTV